MFKVVFTTETTFRFVPIQEWKKKNKPKLLFSERRKLGAMFAEWASQNNVKVCPESTITYLSALGIINVEKAKEILADESSEEH